MSYVSNHKLIRAIKEMLSRKQDNPVISAQSIELGNVLIQWGYETITTNNNVAFKTVIFPKTFSAKPLVQVTLNQNWSNYAAYCGVEDTSIDAIRLFVGINRQASSAMPIVWMAIGPK